MEVSNQEELLHPIKAIVVKKKRGEMGPQVQGNIESGNESSEEERNEEDVLEPMDHYEGESSSTQDWLTQLTNKVDAFWHEHHEFQVRVNQELEELRTQNATILENHNTVTKQLA